MPPTNFGATKGKSQFGCAVDKAIKFSIGTTMSQYTTVEEMLIKKKGENSAREDRSRGGGG